jgi:hypothetical protein
MTGFVCEAELFQGRMCCGRCGLSWDVDDEGAAAGACKPKADPPIGLAEMEQAVRSQARMLVHSQHAAVSAGYRSAPYMPELRKAAVLMAAAAVLERIAGDPRLVAMLKEDRK